MRIDGDRRNRRHQTPTTNDPFHDGHNGIMGSNALIRRAIREQIVNSNGAKSPEEIVRGTNSLLLLDAQQIPSDGIDEFGLEDTFENGIPITLDTLDMPFDVNGLYRHERSIASNHLIKSMVFLATKSNPNANSGAQGAERRGRSS